MRSVRREINGRGPGWILRLAVLVLLGAWIIGAPGYRQIYKGKSKLFPRWIMFHAYGREVCDVKYYSADEDGSLEVLDRYEVLNRERSWSKNRSLVRLRDVRAVKSIGRQMCKSLGEDADVRASARCGGSGKWKVKLKPDKNLCRAKSLGASKRRKS